MAEVGGEKDLIRQLHEVIERRIAERLRKDERIKALEAELLQLRQELEKLRSACPLQASDLECDPRTN
jgi:hypothetical protein